MQQHLLGCRRKHDNGNIDFYIKILNFTKILNIQIVIGGSICSVCQMGKSTKWTENNASNASTGKQQEGGKANSHPTSNTNSLRICFRAKIYSEI